MAPGRIERFVNTQRWQRRQRHFWDQLQWFLARRDLRRRRTNVDQLSPRTDYQQFHRRCLLRPKLQFLDHGGVDNRHNHCPVRYPKALRKGRRYAAGGCEWHRLNRNLGYVAVKPSLSSATSSTESGAPETHRTVAVVAKQELL